MWEPPLCGDELRVQFPDRGPNEGGARGRGQGPPTFLPKERQSGFDNHKDDPPASAGPPERRNGTLCFRYGRSGPVQCRRPFVFFETKPASAMMLITIRTMPMKPAGLCRVL